MTLPPELAPVIEAIGIVAIGDEKPSRAIAAAASRKRVMILVSCGSAETH
jgi:hypothetical protein